MLKIVRVNMSTKEISIESKVEYEYLGGRALSSKIILDEVEPTCEPLGRKNKLVIAPGLLSGTIATSSSRISIGGKSPLTNGIKEANCGGVAGSKLTKCGIKAIVVEGKSDDNNCCVLVINNNGYTLEVRNELKYLGTYDTTSKLHEIYGEKSGVLCVGPAGEKGLRAACVASSDPIGELKFAARGGLGAVMGSKGLKAIVVDDKGAEPVKYCNKEKFYEIAKSLNKKLAEDPKTKNVNQKVGTSGIVKAVNAMGAMPTKNFRFGSFEASDNLSGETLYETIKCRGGYGKTGLSCMEICAIKCSNIYPDVNGEKIVSTLQYENIALLGSNLGMDNLDSVARLNNEINDLGLDAIEIGAALGVALDMGLGKFGEEESCMSLIREIWRDSVIGRMLGNGAKITGQVLGCDRVPVAKGQAFAGYDPRALKGNGVTYAMSTMGADHTAANCFGARNTVNPIGKENQGALVKGLQKQMATLDSLGFCIFARPPLFEDPSILSNLANLFTGSNYDKDTIWELGINAVRMEREFNIRSGVSPAEDRLPEYLYEEELEPLRVVFDISEEEMKASFV